jgi:hypothetical protein
MRAITASKRSAGNKIFTADSALGPINKGSIDAASTALPARIGIKKRSPGKK